MWTRLTKRWLCWLDLGTGVVEESVNGPHTGIPTQKSLWTVLETCLFLFPGWTTVLKGLAYSKRIEVWLFSTTLPSNKLISPALDLKASPGHTDEPRFTCATRLCGLACGRCCGDSMLPHAGWCGQKAIMTMVWNHTVLWGFKRFGCSMFQFCWNHNLFEVSLCVCRCVNITDFCPGP